MFGALGYTMEDMKNLLLSAETHASSLTKYIVDFLSHASPSESMGLIEEEGVIRANRGPKSGHPLSPIAIVAGL